MTVWGPHWNKATNTPFRTADSVHQAAMPVCHSALCRGLSRDRKEQAARDGMCLTFQLLFWLVVWGDQVSVTVLDFCCTYNGWLGYLTSKWEIHLLPTHNLLQRVEGEPYTHIPLACTPYQPCAKAACYRAHTGRRQNVQEEITSNPKKRLRCKSSKEPEQW